MNTPIPDFTNFRTRRGKVPVVAVLRNVFILLLWISLVIGVWSFVIGLTGLWLWKFSAAWACFWIGGNTALWSALLLWAREELASELKDSNSQALRDGHACLGDNQQAQENPFRVECAWCHVVLKENEGAETSHGICPVCVAKNFPEEAGI